VFKVFYSGIIGEENSYEHRTWLYLAASASAEFFADIALSPMEAAKVHKLFIIIHYIIYVLDPCASGNISLETREAKKINMLLCVV